MPVGVFLYNYTNMDKYIGRTVMLSPEEYGKLNTGVKGKRPFYILRKKGERYIVVVSTQTPKSTTKKKRKYIEYKYDGGKSWLRLDLKDGFNILTERMLDKYEVNNMINLNEDQVNELNRFYTDFACFYDQQ